MIDILSGRIQHTGALPIGDRGGGQRSRFVFSALDHLDPEGRYKVIIHNWLARGLPVNVDVSGVVKPVHFHVRSFQKRFEVEDINQITLVEAVLRAKVNLLINRKGKREGSEFGLLCRMLYEGPERSLSFPSTSAMEELVGYSRREGKSVRLSRGRFDLQESLTIQDGFIAMDVKKTLKTGNVKVKISRIYNGPQIVRRIDDPNPRLISTMTRFRNTPYVMPTLATARYVNKKERDVFISYHPYFKENLYQFMAENKCLSYDLQINIAHQILAGIKAINKEGVHGNLSLNKIFICKKTEPLQVFIGGLESFIPNGEFSMPILTSWSAPEVLNRTTPRSPGEKEDVWQLGILFQTLFQKKIDAYIQSKEFPPSIAVMIQGMLQVDPVKRWSMRQVLDYFQNEVLNKFGELIKPLRKSEIPVSSFEALQTYAKQYKQTIRFSARYFHLKCSATVTPDFVAIDVKNSLIASNGTKIKLAFLPNATRIVRRIDRYNPNMVKILRLFLDTPHVLPTLEMARYTNKKGQDILVSYHPLFEMDLLKALIERQSALDFKSQVQICHQIILGMEKIHEIGVHGDLYLRNILINKDGHVVISDLETFKPHDASEKEWGLPMQCYWSAPEVRVKYPPPAEAKQDVWSLGLIFHSLFQKENRYPRYFRGCTQREIRADIIGGNFSDHVAQMIYSMLQIDPAKRLSLKEVSQYFQKNILLIKESGIVP